MTSGRDVATWLRAAVAVLMTTGLAEAAEPPQGNAAQLADLGLEQLLGLDVYAASRFPQPMAEAPSAITVITGDDIRQFGYRTLGDVLRSIPGLHVSSDRMYDFLGVRGIRRAGDFNAPVLLLVDGRRQNDNVYEAAAIGHELPVPMQLIERVEFVRGPGSSVFGSNALLGVINVVTRKPGDRQRLRAVAQAGSAGLREGYLQVEPPLGEGSSLLLSASHGDRDGEDIHLPALADGGFDGYLRGLDHQQYQQFTAKLVSGPWTLQAAHGAREKQSPLPVYGADRGDPSNEFRDRQGFASLDYQSLFGADWLLQGQLFHGYYNYRGDLLYDGVVNRDIADGRWWGGELNAVYRGFAGHRLLMGLDFQRDYRQQQINYDLDPYQLHQDNRQQGFRFGVYAQDDWRLGERLSLNAGLRYDSYSEFEGVTTPRVALIARPWDRQTLKLVYGRAYRVPSNFELYYEVEGYTPNLDLVPEVASNWDLIWENRVSDTLRLQVAAQWLEIKDFIVQNPTPDSSQFTNRDRVQSRGLDLIVDKHWSQGIRSRASLSLQRARADSTDRDLEDAPRWLAKLHSSAPLWAGSRLGAELLGVGRRNTAVDSTGSYWLLNLTVSNIALGPRLRLGASVDNLLDERYADPSSADLVAAGIPAVPAEGRQFRLNLEAEF